MFRTCRLTIPPPRHYRPNHRCSSSEDGLGCGGSGDELVCVVGRTAAKFDSSELRTCVTGGSEAALGVALAAASSSAPVVEASARFWREIKRRKRDGRADSGGANE
mmetsp:Transcript_50790/g.82099  ORF Transcript_50790/g.82099 Transcript_50790/m.82099 type:complete len:106 (+) Transcript_50790:158-475(+)